MLIRRGDRGQAVENVQRALNNAGFNIAVDGVFGQKTENAVIAFQTQNNLAVDGLVGSNTLKALGLSDSAQPLQPAQPAASSISYDRQAALTYAHKYWNRVPNEDGVAFIGSSTPGNFKKVPVGTKFVHNFGSNGNSLRSEHAKLPDGSRISWEDLDDCTHFISCCIGAPPGGEKAGGMPIKHQQVGIPPNAPYAIVRVATMVEYLTSNDQKWRDKRPGKEPYAIMIGEKTTDENLIEKLSPGDLIAYFSPDTGRYAHMAMYLGNGKIVCHTYCRSDSPDCTWDNEWDLGKGSWQWTFIQITV